MPRRAMAPRTTAQIGTETVAAPQITYMAGGPGFPMAQGREAMAGGPQGGVYPVDPGFHTGRLSFAQQPAPSARVLPNLQALAPQIGQIQGPAAAKNATPGAPTGIRAKTPGMQLAGNLKTSLKRSPGEPGRAGPAGKAGRSGSYFQPEFAGASLGQPPGFMQTPAHPYDFRALLEKFAGMGRIF